MKKVKYIQGNNEYMLTLLKELEHEISSGNKSIFSLKQIKDAILKITKGVN